MAQGDKEVRCGCSDNGIPRGEAQKPDGSVLPGKKKKTSNYYPPEKPGGFFVSK